MNRRLFTPSKLSALATRPPWRGLAALTVLVGLTACGSAPPRPGPVDRQPLPRPVTEPPRQPLLPPSATDGAEANPPPGLLQVPDAEPVVEPVRSGGPNKPYQVLGQAYTPLQGDPALVERGLASWYGRKFHGRRTANGETYNMYAMSAAHKTMPLPSFARVRNPANGREVVVRVNDRGPFHPGRVIDLSYTAALKLGLLHGVGAVEVERITHDAIRTGAWRPVRPADTAVAGLAAAPARPADAGPAAAPAPPRPSAADPGLVAAGAPTAPPAPSAPSPAPRAELPPETAAPARAAAQAAPGYWLQLGAFAQPEGALRFHQRVSDEVAWLAPLLAVFSDRSLHRLQAGPYPSRSEAQGAAQRLREALQLVPAIVERR